LKEETRRKRKRAKAFFLDQKKLIKAIGIGEVKPATPRCP
jgi:hypothetical protein